MQSKFVYFGTPYVARDTLAALLAAGHRPSLVVTNPDAPKGRGMELTACPTKELALAENLPVVTPDTLDTAAIETIKSYGSDYAIVIAYGKLFPQALIDAFPRGALNVHYSLLPKYRGAAPVERALLHGETETGVSVQQLALKMDAGPLLAQKSLALATSDTVHEVFPKLIALGAELLLETLPKLEGGELSPTPQDESQASSAPKIKKEEGELSLAAPATENWNKYRAYLGRPGTYFFKDGKRVKIVKASFANNQFVIERVVPEGKSEMAYADFVRKQ